MHSAAAAVLLACLHGLRIPRGMGNGPGPWPCLAPVVMPDRLPHSNNLLAMSCTLHANLLCRFWINNQSRMYLLEGTAELQHHYHLKMGDVLIFAQKEDTTIVLAGRPPTKADAMKKPLMRRASPAAVAKPASARREGVSRASCGPGIVGVRFVLARGAAEMQPRDCWHGVCARQQRRLNAALELLRGVRGASSTCRHHHQLYVTSRFTDCCKKQQAAPVRCNVCVIL